MVNIQAANNLKNELSSLLVELSNIQDKIRIKLSTHAENKNLKGNEIVGWLGEIYGKLLLNGELVDDSKEHDLVTPERWRVSVKTRKGVSPSWRRSSAIPKIEGDDCPTHLLFVKLNGLYELEQAWLFNWKDLREEGRFRKKKVRGLHRSFIFMLKESLDSDNEIYPTNKFGL